MSLYKQLSDEEVIGITTINCCANAVEDCAKKIARRLGEKQKQAISNAVQVMKETVKAVLDAAPDEDQREMILRRMSRLQLQFGAVRKHPEEMVMLSMEDAQTLLAPVLDRCDLDCPCVSIDDDGDKAVSTLLVKQCETRKALKRAGVAELGLGMECPYQFLTGGKKKKPRESGRK